MTSEIITVKTTSRGRVLRDRGSGRAIAKCHWTVGTAWSTSQAYSLVPVDCKGPGITEVRIIMAFDDDAD